MIWELRHEHKISLLIEVSGLPRSTYYYYVKRRTVTDKYSAIKEQITVIYKVVPDLIKRDFEAAKPNQKWVTDVTEFSLFGKKLYLSPILDLYSRDVVSYVISDRPVLSMVMRMLDKAFAKIPNNTKIIHHSDQGWQYQHKRYQQALQEKGIFRV